MTTASADVPNTEHRKGLAAAFVAAVLWSTGGIFIKLIPLGALEISGLRSALAALTILALYRRRSLKFNWSIALNGLFYAGVMILFVVATKLTTAANAIFLQYTAPIYVLVFEPLLLKSRFRKINLVAVVVSFAGMALFFMERLSPSGLEGNLVALATGVFLAAFFIGLRRSPSEDKLPSVFWGNAFTTALCLPAIASIETITFSDAWMIAALGVFQIGVPYAVFSYAVERVEAIEASLIAMIEPVLNPVWVVIGYGEEPSTWAIVGGSVILAGAAFRAVVSEFLAKRKARRSAEPPSGVP